MAHEYYQPTEYEEMLLAAGWVTIEDLDPAYRAYERATGSDAMNYQHWQETRRELDALNKQYESEFGTLVKLSAYGHYEFSRAEEKRMDKLIAEMAQLEIMLGY